MNAHLLLAKVEVLGVTLKVEGDRLLYRSQEAVSPALMAELRAHKAELLELLTWPTESCDPGRRRAWLAERLCPFVGQTVETPQGRGRLVAVLPEFVAVDLYRRRRRANFLPCEVRPPAAAAPQNGDPRR